MEGISVFKESNIGGVISLRLIDSKLCPPFKIVNNEVTTSLNTSLNWFEITPTQNTIKFSCVGKLKQGIRLYISELECIIPKHRLSIDRKINSLNRSRWVLLITGANGDQLIIGTKDAPVKFEQIDLKYNKKATQKNAYRFQFSVRSTIKPAFYTHVETDIPNPSNFKTWENGQLAQWEDGTQFEFENL